MLKIIIEIGEDQDETAYCEMRLEDHAEIMDEPRTTTILLTRLGDRIFNRIEKLIKSMSDADWSTRGYTSNKGATHKKRAKKAIPTLVE